MSAPIKLMRTTLPVSVVTTDTSSSSSGTGLASQTSALISTAPLAPNAHETGVLTLGTTGAVSILYEVTVNAAARVRLYSTAAKRDADVTRPNTIPPTPGTSHGVLVDLYLDGINAALVWWMSPATFIYNGDDPQVRQVYYTINTLDKVNTNAITATFVYDPTQI